MNGIIHPCTHGNAEGEIIILDGKRYRYCRHMYEFI
jgi:alpha-acetolactate decarboxylase